MIVDSRIRGYKITGYVLQIKLLIVGLLHTTLYVFTYVYYRIGQDWREKTVMFVIAEHHMIMNACAFPPTPHTHHHHSGSPPWRLIETDHRSFTVL